MRWISTVYNSRLCKKVLALVLPIVFSRFILYNYIEFLTRQLENWRILKLPPPLLEIS